MSSSPTPSSTSQTIRGRGGFRNGELNTIPANLAEAPLRAPDNADGHKVQILANFVKVKSMDSGFIYSYRVDYEPNIESVTLRRRLFRKAVSEIFGSHYVYDGYSDARSSKETKEPTTEFEEIHPEDPNTTFKIIIKRTGTVAPNSHEMLRLYNMNMKKCFEALGFFKISNLGSYVHPEIIQQIGAPNSGLFAVRGYNANACVSESGDILMKFESCQKIMQRQNVLQYIRDFENRGQNWMDNVKSMLIGKLIVTGYNKVVYRIEDVNFQMSPRSTFQDRRQNREISFLEYFRNRYNLNLRDENQPLLLVVQNNRRRQEEQSNDIYVVPELCNIAGLTDQQRNDNRLKTDLIRASQISPADRVRQMNTLLRKLHESDQVRELLGKWGCSYATEPVKLMGRLLPMESVGVGRFAADKQSWQKADPQSGSFEPKIMSARGLAKAPTIPKLAIIIPKIHPQQYKMIMDNLKTGMDKIGLQPSPPRVLDLPNDSAQQYVSALRSLPDDVTMTIVVLQNQNKERYDAVKKLATVERGIATQVVTARLMTDERKVGGASVKIAIQIAAKVGGEPWYIDVPTTGYMICGYDTYHDTTDRSRSYGAFIASTNTTFSRWYSKADRHERLDELSSHIAANMIEALKRFKELNQGRYPRCVYIYRDGVSDGQIDHVYNVELKQIEKALKDVDANANIRLTFVIVNKRIGAQFYMRQNEEFKNPNPGTVIDSIVTRQIRYDFYLISQSTRHGTVSPTYYNIIHDESGLRPEQHQMLAYKLCFLYYNWAGTVKVPAPCQYAHKLALLCGEHLHNVPSAVLDDRLHFL